MHKELDIVRTKEFSIKYTDSKVKNVSSFQHYHDSYEIAFFIEANMQIFVKDLQYHIGDGDILFTNEYDIHRIVYHTAARYTRYVVNFKKEYLLPLIKTLNVENLLWWYQRKHYKKISTNLKQRAEIDYLFKEMLKASRKSTSTVVGTVEAEVKSYLMLVLIRLSEFLSTNNPMMELGKKERLVKGIVQFIDANYHTDIDLERLQREFYLNKFHISHIFKEITGFTVIEYLQHRRVIEAQKMLRTNNREIIDICFDCGFNNLQHFYRVFKKVSKVTPSQYRIHL